MKIMHGVIKEIKENSLVVSAQNNVYELSIDAVEKAAVEVAIENEIYIVAFNPETEALVMDIEEDKNDQLAGL